MNSASSFAPGRVELLGNHTDYNEGYVLSAAINHGIEMKGEQRSDNRIQLRSRQMDSVVEVDAADFSMQQGEKAWANYPLGVVRCLLDEGFALGGFSAQISSDLPVGAGLSSSAAIEVSTALLLKKLFEFEIAPLDLAKLCRRAENTFVGVNCGLLDQVSSIFGRDGHVVFLDCRHEKVESVPFPRHLELLITHSGVKHALVGGEYNERRQQCFEAAHALDVPMLRDASLETLEAGRSKMPDITYRRAKHIVGENTRVLEGIGMLRRGDGAGFGRLMFDSHESSMLNFENSAPELDTLVELAATLPGVLGSRLTGGGFGGATVSLVETENAGAIQKALTAAYRKRTGNTCRCWVVKAAEGAR